MALRPRAVVVVVLAAYAVGAWVLFSPLGLVDPAHVPGCACGDIAQQVWLLEWARLSASHGTVAWHSGLMDYPRGIDLADSASFPFLGFVAAPLTSLVGPVAALGVLFRVAIWATAAAGFGLARRLGLSRLAAGVAGAASGFGPAMVHQASVHVFLVFLPMLYAAVAVVHAQWTGAPDRWKARGLLLGALVLAQTFTDPEMLLSALLVAVTLIGLVGGWRLARSVVGGLRREPLLGAVPHARSTLAALATAAAVATPGVRGARVGAVRRPRSPRRPRPEPGVGGSLAAVCRQPSVPAPAREPRTPPGDRAATPRRQWLYRGAGPADCDRDRGRVAQGLGRGRRRR